MRKKTVQRIIPRQGIRATLHRDQLSSGYISRRYHLGRCQSNHYPFDLYFSHLFLQIFTMASQCCLTWYGVARLLPAGAKGIFIYVAAFLPMNGAESIVIEE